MSKTCRMTSCKSFRVLALASKAGACCHEELAHSCKEQARHRHRGRQVQEGSLMPCVRSWKDDEGQASLEDNHDNDSTLRTAHMDLFGPTHYSTLTTTACLYGFVIVDDYSRYTWVHIILYKTEVQDVFRRFANRAMNNYGVKIKHI